MLAAALMALNYQIFILQNSFAPAGINGLATIIQYVFHFSIGYVSLLINIPLAIVSFFVVGKEFSVKTLLFTLVFSFSLLLMQNNIIDVSRFVYHTSDGRSTLLAPVVSGVINGGIYAVAIRNGGSTGGTDFVAAFIHKKRPDYSMLRIILVLNCCVAFLSYFVYDFNIEPVILCVVYCYLTSTTSDNLLKRGSKAIRAEIITTHPDEITNLLLHHLRHGVTVVKGEGGFSHSEKSVLICVFNKHQITAFTEIMQQFQDTFVCVSDVNSTLGNFKHITN